MTDTPSEQLGSKDGTGAGDHDEPYTFRSPSVRWPFPFTERQLARLLILRSKVQSEPKPSPKRRTRKKKEEVDAS